MVARRKYPRTPHLPWSPGASSDDKVLKDTSHFEGREVVVTVKRDGECTTIYGDGHAHARSLDSGPGSTAKLRASRAWVKALAAEVGPSLPGGWVLCGENLWATHSIRYDGLLSTFEAFSLWDGDTCLPWSETVEWLDLLDVEPVPALYRGPWDEESVRRVLRPYETRERRPDKSPVHRDIAGDEIEGYVVRLAGAFRRDDFARSVAKWVRAGHVQTDTHWAHGKLERNQVR